MASRRGGFRDQLENLEFIKCTDDWMKSMQSTSAAKTTEGEEELTVEQHVIGALRMVDVSHGRCVCRLTVSKKLQNRYGSLHGGVIATLVDVVGSAALMTIVGPPGGVSTDINVSYITAAWNEEEVEVESVTLRAGKSLAVAEVTLRRIPSGEIVAQGRHTKFLAIGQRAKL